VLKHAVRPADGALSEKQIAYKRAKNTSKVVLDQKVGLRNEICCIVECFAATRQMWHLQELEFVLQQADKDLEYMPPIENVAMRKFVDNEEVFEEGDAASMIEEIRHLWHDVRIGATELAILKEQLVEDDIQLDYRYPETGYLQDFTFQWSQVLTRNHTCQRSVHTKLIQIVKFIVHMSYIHFHSVTASSNIRFLFSLPFAQPRKGALTLEKDQPTPCH